MDVLAAGAPLETGRLPGAELVDVRRRRVGTEDRLSARLRAGDRRFDWKAWARPSGDLRVVLSLGNVVDPARGSMLERSEDRTLEAIRRSFRVFSGDAGPGRSG